MYTCCSNEQIRLCICFRENLENTKELVLIPRLRVHIIEICVENKTILCD